MAPAEKEKTNGSTEPKQRRRPGRVPVSCAECRRLKLRCDRKVPCETCVKRGCSAICPEGTFIITSTFISLALADAEELQKKIERLRNRSTALEEALRTLQAAVSDEPHPLLQESSIQAGPAECSPSRGVPDGPLLSREDEEILDAFGTLTLGLRGESRFFGQTARSEVCLTAPTRNLMPCSAPYPRISEELVKEANMELDIACSNRPVQQQILTHLPPLSQACHLCEIFLEYGQFMWYPIPRDELFDEIMGRVYQSVPEQVCSLSSTHATSLLFMVFALTTLFDPSMPPYSIEAHEYYLLARLSLRCGPPIHDTTLFAIQSMIYMAQYLELSDCEPAHTGSHKAWLQIGLAVKLGYSTRIFIYVDMSSARWKLHEDACQRRSRVFWQLFLQDTWISFGFGRPPSMSLAFIDCGFPKDPLEKVNEQGQKEWGFHHWTWQYTRLLNQVITSVFGARPPQYSTIVEYDRKIRDFPVPYNLRPKCNNDGFEPNQSIPELMQRFFTMSCKEATLLSLHRPFFVQALHEQPVDLLRHRYGPSVMAIYRSAWRIIEIARGSFKRATVVASRIGIIWSQSLAAGIVMCLLVTRAPGSPLASSSLNELDKLCDLFEQAAGSSQIASNNLDVVRKLRRQGHEVMTRPRSPGDREVVVDKELDRLGGRTHLISSAHDPPTSCSTSSAAAAAAAVTSFTPSPTPVTDVIHPTIMQDLRVFEGTSGSIDFDFRMEWPSNVLQQQPQAFLPESNNIFDELFGTQSFPVEPDPEPVGPPVLDATWQSFIEQLGF
ncbi:uncharacterized protein LAESUDRAFT_648494 [Laetiporus sulphureus 93-53]|uniref:Zn(2)-C6 fungal-type domain-containing protein n=1 Tax=Laetiporus sulphureus 93-53 TaxID=1314785 RepID=A0A165FDM5_9APHY|nr:uncharacterized protein LAESUDRAFT_648494 [Laetiporus sulphureus 93-53]KZT08809.1 hypothetical protein LAESUDRAFT_648494 [Laetiporus sulphureus 93-53]